MLNPLPRPRHPRVRQDAVTAAGELLVAARALNSSRVPDHRESIALAIALAEDSFRLPNSQLPAPRADPLLDAVHALHTQHQSGGIGPAVYHVRLAARRGECLEPLRQRKAIAELRVARDL